MNNIKKNNPGIFLIHVLSAITRNVYSYFFFILFTASAGCSPSKQIARQASALLMNDSAIISGHTGISIYEPATGKFWYNHNATKYFTPASNTKLFTLYAGMKYLGDSLLSATIEEDKGTMNIFPNGDPAFLNPEFIYQPLLSLLKQTNKKIIITDTAWKENALGRGWAWDDYNDDHMTERSPMPVFGNIVTVRGTPLKNNIQPPFFTSRFTWDSSRNRNEHISSVTRERSENLFHGLNHSNIEVLVTIPFITNDGSTGYGILEDVLGKKIEQSRM